MGRTFRQRKRNRTAKDLTSLSSDPNFVGLTRWMSINGWKQTCKLRLVDFIATGRGFMAGHYIHKDDVLVSIPKCLLVTTATVCNSTIGHFIMLGSNLGTDSFLCQELLASFLLWEKHLKEASAWSAYISTLPISFTLPIFLDKGHIVHLPHFIKEPVLSSVEIVQNCHSHLLSYLKGVRCDHCKLWATDIFSWDDFVWSWCCVNTRAVFIEPDFVPKHQLRLKDRNCLALAPYLDMFNHSDSAEVNVSLNSNNDCYEIVTKKPFQKFKEVFINYGPHSNTKLYVEYGFVLPSTVHDAIPLKLEHFIDACKLASVDISHEFQKIQFCLKHGLDSQLYLSDSELSWNSCTVLQILISTSCDVKMLEQISFKGNDSFLQSEKELRKVKKQLFLRVEDNLRRAQNLVLERCNSKCCKNFKAGNSPALDMCKLLLETMMTTVSTVIECDI